MSRTRIFVTLALAAALGVAVAGFWGFKTRMAQTEILRTSHGQWLAREISWQRIGDAWRVQAAVYPDRVKPGRFEHIELLHALCGAFLSTLPDATDAVVKRDNVFRVDIHLFKGPKLEDEVMPSFAPIAVTSGSCQVPEDIMFPTYPAPLQDWYLASGGAKKVSEENILPAVEFRLRKGRLGTLEEFPARAACDYVLADPLTRASQTRNEAFPDLPQESGALVVVVRKTLWASVLTFGASKEFTYEIANGLCLPGKKSEA